MCFFNANSNVCVQIWDTRHLLRTLSLNTKAIDLNGVYVLKIQPEFSQGKVLYIYCTFACSFYFLEIANLKSKYTYVIS